MNAECIGDARCFLKKAAAYASERKVFGRPIGQNQGVQFPIAKDYVQTEAAALMTWHAAGSIEWAHQQLRQLARAMAKLRYSCRKQETVKRLNSTSSESLAIPTKADGP